MNITRVSSTSPYAHAIGSSSAVRAGNLVALAALDAATADGTVIGGADPYEQTRACLARAMAALADFGASAADVIQTRLYVANAVDRHAVGRAHREVFDHGRPSATMIVVALRDPRILVEIDLLAWVAQP